MIEDLPIAEGAGRNGILLNAAFEEGFGFLNEAVSEHGFDALVDSFSEAGGRAEEDDEGRRGRFGRPSSSLSGGGLPGLPNDFQSADDAPEVFWIDLRKQQGVFSAKFLQKFFRGRLLQLASQGGVTGGEVVQSFAVGFEVESGASAEDWELLSLFDFADGLGCSIDKLPGVECLAKIGNVDQVMRDEGSLLRRRFRRADIKSAIDLHGVCGNDFSGNFSGQLHGQVGFSHRRGACEENGKRRGAHFGFESLEAAVRMVEGSETAFFLASEDSFRQERRRSNPTPAQMAVSATLNAGKPHSPPPRWRV